MQEKIDLKYTPVDATSQMKHVTSVHSIFNPLEKTDAEAMTHALDSDVSSEPCSPVMRKCETPPGENSSHSSMSHIIEDTQKSRSSSSLLGQTVRRDQPVVTRAQSSAVPQVSGYTSEAAVCGWAPRDEVNINSNIAERAAQKTLDQEPSHVPRIEGDVFQGYIEDAENIRAASSGTVVMDTQATVALDMACMDELVSQPRSRGYTTENKVTTGLLSQGPSGVRSIEQGISGEYTTESSQLSGRKPQNSVTVYQSSSKDSTQPWPSTTTHSSIPQLLPPSAFSTPRVVTTTTSPVGHTHMKPSNDDFSHQLNTSTSSSTHANGYLAETNHMTPRIGTSERWGGLSGVREATLSEDLQQQREPSKFLHVPLEFHSVGISEPQMVGENAYTQPTTFAPQQSSPDQVSAPRGFHGNGVTPQVNLSSGVCSPGENTSSQVVSGEYMTEEAFTPGLCSGVERTLLTGRIGSQTVDSQLYPVEGTCYTSDSKPAHTKPHQNLLPHDAVSPPSISSVESDYLPHHLHTAIVPTSLGQTATRDTRDRLTLESTQPQAGSPLEAPQVPKPGMPFTITLMQSKHTPLFPDDGKSKVRELDTTEDHLGLQAGSHSSSSPSGCTSLEDDRSLTSLSSVFDPEEREGNSPPIHHPDSDPLSSFHLSSNSQHAYSTSGYSSSVNFNGSESDTYMFSIPEFPEDNTAIILNTGYTSHGDAPSYPRSSSGSYTSQQDVVNTSTKHYWRPANISIPPQTLLQRVPSNSSASAILTPALSRDDGYMSDSPTSVLHHRPLALPKYSSKDLRFARLQQDVYSPLSIDSFPLVEP